MVKRTEPIKVLVVDDSAVMRNILTQILNDDAAIRVVGIARNGQDALQKLSRLSPDVVTMDVEMPVMDGLTAVKKIMAVNPVPVIMLSGLTARGTRETIEALEAGAVDFITKPAPGAGVEDLASTLTTKVKGAASAAVQKCTSGGRQDVIPVRSYSQTGLFSVVIIGTSTGGPSALQQVIPKFPRTFSVPIIVVQHMPPGFTGPLAERLDKSSELKVKEAANGDEVMRGTVLVAPAGKQLLLEKNAGTVKILLKDNVNYQTLFKPSVDVTMTSAANTFQSRTLGVILTGMGNDGTQGATLIKEKGGTVIAQDEESCVVYGMPRAVFEAGQTNAVFPLVKISQEVIRLV